jgi:tubulin polyglutamylase TTLL1
MIPISRIFLLFLASYAVIFLTVYNFRSAPSSIEDLYSQGKTNALASNNVFLAEEFPDVSVPLSQVDPDELGTQTPSEPEIVETIAVSDELTRDHKSEFQKQRKEAMKSLGRKSHILNKLTSPNPFKILGAYAEIPEGLVKPKYDTVHFGLMNEDDYCERTDRYNLLYTDNIFKNKNIFTDYLPWMMISDRIIPQIGEFAMPHIPGPMSKATYNTSTYPFEPKITNFYVTTDGFYRYHEMGKHYLCATQMFNHIPGHRSVVRKDEVLKSVARYTELNEGKPECFNKNMIFPRAYRLHFKSECKSFFKKINSQKYINSLENEPIQYLIKIGFGVHKSQGVFLLDQEENTRLNNAYDFGKKCGEMKKSIIAQKYITNPLLLDRNNKFDFRMYMFIASTNPLITYYHDGYMRVSVNEFEKTSKDRATHLTNTYLAEKKFAEAREENKTINGMNAEELKDYHLWDFMDLQEYLLEIGKINDTNWLDNYLRPEFKKALVHIMRASSYTFWKQSNLYELFGLDFMLDEDLKLWFIEANPNPLLTGVKPELIERMLLDMFEIQYAYYHSRMKRVLNVIQKMQIDAKVNDKVDYGMWRKEYQEAVKNRLEPEYKLSGNNTFSLFIDQNLLPSSAAYFGYLDEACLSPEIDIK